MTENEKRELVVKAIRKYAQEHYGWSAKYHPEDREKFEVLIEWANRIERSLAWIAQKRQ